LDQHSREGDPQLVDPDGIDGDLGYDTSGDPASVRVIDNGDLGFSTVGTWTSRSGGLGDEQLYSSGVATATWSFDGLAPGTYRVAASWAAAGSGFDTTAQYRFYSDGDYVTATTRNHYNTNPDDFEAGGSWWEVLKWVRVLDGSVQVTVSDENSGRVLADAIRIERIEGDFGTDDDLRLQSGSIAIDAGNPASEYLKEPVANGSRVNLGAYGNTTEATTSPDEIVQVLSPNGLEKYEVGQQVQVEWRLAGQLEREVVTLINAGGGGLSGEGSWLSDRYRSTGTTRSDTEVVDTSGVTDPAPSALYQTRGEATWGVGNRLSYALPVEDGDYIVRLHFAEYAYAANQRLFDIELNGVLAQSGYDIWSEAGGNDRAVVAGFTVTASGGEGIALNLVNITSVAAILGGIEVLRANPAGVAAPTVDLELSVDDGANWTTVATGLGVNRYGNGSYSWVAGPETAGNSARFRVVSNDGTQPVDDCDAGFLITNPGQDYYVNDADLMG
ncbi:MAG: hypothetical protein GY713_23295, partial [Actinomycetia bacterium]|nr:hypothetical protein [Actinomycetes bacterium]